MSERTHTVSFGDDEEVDDGEVEDEDAADADADADIVAALFPAL
jgi:hypothetical protein